MSIRTTIVVSLLLAIVLVILLQRFQCQPAGAEQTAAAKLDSMHLADSMRIAVKNKAIVMLQDSIYVILRQRRGDSAAIARANEVIKPLNKKVIALIEANQQLKAANDLAGRLVNCDSLADYSGRLAYLEDSLRSMHGDFDQHGSDLSMLYDRALSAANDKALELTRQITVRDSLLRVVPAPAHSRWGIGATIGMVAGPSGFTYGGSVGITYQFFQFKNRKR